jgi:hypothetical protein
MTTIMKKPPVHQKLQLHPYPDFLLPECCILFWLKIRHMHEFNLSVYALLRVYIFTLQHENSQYSKYVYLVITSLLQHLGRSPILMILMIMTIILLTKYRHSLLK